MYPTIVDGRSLVILRQTKWGFSTVAKGVLEYDGQTLYLADGSDRRIITDAELASFQFVTPESRIKACRGFDLFMIVE